MRRIFEYRIAELQHQNSVPRVTVKILFPTRVIPCRICDGQSGTGTSFSSSTSFPPSLFHSTNAPYSSSSSAVIATHERATSGDVPTKVMLFCKLRSIKKSAFIVAGL